MNYTYDDVGNVTSIDDTVRNETSNFSYDGLDRLVSATGVYTQGWNIDEIGRMLVFTRTATPYSYSYGDAAHKHAATQVDYNDGMPKSDTYQYDANGNTTYREENGVESWYSYNMWNQLARVISGTTSPITTTFSYDGDGQRAKKTVDNGSSVNVTYYVTDLYEKKDGVVTKRYFADGQAIAQRVGGSLSFIFSDHLGSASLLADSSGNVQEAVRYYAYGETRLREGSDLTNYLYTSRELDPSNDLYYYGARYYDPRLGRFLTADVVGPDKAYPLTRDRYAYVLGNPLRYTDPTGQWCSNRSGSEASQCTGLQTWFKGTYGIEVQELVNWSFLQLRDLRLAIQALRNDAGWTAAGFKYAIGTSTEPTNEYQVYLQIKHLDRSLGYAAGYQDFWSADGNRQLGGLIQFSNNVDASDPWSQFTFVHELTHAIDVRTKLNNRDTGPGSGFARSLMTLTGGKVQWSDVFRKLIYLPGGNPPSDYSYNWYSEDFAETVAHCIFPNYWLKDTLSDPGQDWQRGAFWKKVYRLVKGRVALRGWIVQSLQPK